MTGFANGVCNQQDVSEFKLNGCNIFLSRFLIFLQKWWVIEVRRCRRRRRLCPHRRYHFLMGGTIFIMYPVQMCYACLQ